MPSLHLRLSTRRIIRWMASLAILTKPGVFSDRLDLAIRVRTVFLAWTVTMETRMAACRLRRPNQSSSRALIALKQTARRLWHHAHCLHQSQLWVLVPAVNSLTLAVSLVLYGTTRRTSRLGMSKMERLKHQPISLATYLLSCQPPFLHHVDLEQGTGHSPYQSHLRTHLQHLSSPILQEQDLLRLILSFQRAHWSV